MPTTPGQGYAEAPGPLLRLLGAPDGLAGYAEGPRHRGLGLAVAAQQPDGGGRVDPVPPAPPSPSPAASGQTKKRPGWRDLMNRFSRHFDEGVRVQAELTGRDIGIVALRENIDTSGGPAAAKVFRRSMLAQGAGRLPSGLRRPASGPNYKQAGHVGLNPSNLVNRWLFDSTSSIGCLHHSSRRF